jgi:histidinol-phosphatase
MNPNPQNAGAAPTRRPDLAAELEFAVEAAWNAGKITLRYFQSGVIPEIKQDRSPVTIADREAEMCLRAAIERSFPEDGIVGEEFGTARADAPRRWILDPIDGTRSFVRGVPLYGVLVALEQGSEPVVGVVHFPALGETISAARGLGCLWNGRRAHVSQVGELPRAAILATEAERVPAGTWQALGKGADLVRTWGDCYGHALVATGRAEVMLDPVAAVWDAAALSPVIAEAGGVFSDWEGNAGHRGGSAVSTNAVLAEEVRRILSVTS